MAIGWRPLGIITVAASGTPQRFTSKQADPTAPILCYSVMLQQVPGNNGYLAIGPSTVNYSTQTNINALCAIPTSNSLPSATAGILTQAEQRLNAADYYCDVSSSGDKFLASVLTDEDI